MASIINAATSGGLISTADTSGILQLQTASTTAVTVNASQNVGIGTSSPSYKLDVVAASSSAIPARLKGNASGNNNTQLRFAGNNSGTDLWAVGTEVSTSSTGTAFDFYDLTASANRMRLDSAGNLGLGVTPSAWNTSYKALQVGASAVLWSTGTGGARLGVNYFLNSADSLRYISSNFATDYRQSNGEHQFFNAASGTAGNAITFTQAMTLDASGNLLVGTTSGSYTAGSRGNITVGGSTSAVYALQVGGTAKGYTFHDGTDMTLANDANGYLRFNTNASERARITSGGDMEFKNSGGTSVSFIGVSSTAAQFGNRQNDAMILYTNNTERARIDSSGRILVNGTQSTTNTFLQVNTNGGNGASGYMAVMANGGSVANQTAGIYLARTNNSIISNVDGSGNFRDNIIVQAGGSGGVVLTTTATAWASNSDIRKKIIIEPISNALSGILSWRTIIGRYKTDNEQRRRLFLIAQDVLATNPEAVVVQDEGQESEDLLLGYSDTIPVLVAAIKEQQALITQLTERITALEAN